MDKRSEKAKNLQNIIDKLNGKPIECNECPKHFINSQFLKKHKINKHKKLDENNNTDECKVISTDPKKSVDVKQKRFECKLCKKTYSFRFNLHRHKKHQHGDAKKSFKCEICPSTFTWKFNLYRHLKSSHRKDK